MAHLTGIAGGVAAAAPGSGPGGGAMAAVPPGRAGGTGRAMRAAAGAEVAPPQQIGAAIGVAAATPRCSTPTMMCTPCAAGAMPCTMPLPRGSASGLGIGTARRGSSANAGALLLRQASTQIHDQPPHPRGAAEGGGSNPTRGWCACSACGGPGPARPEGSALLLRGSRFPYRDCTLGLVCMHPDRVRWDLYKCKTNFLKYFPLLVLQL